MNFWAKLVLVVSFLFFQCSEFLMDTVKEPVLSLNSKKILRVSDSTEINLNVDGLNISDINYSWSVNSGIIKGIGNRVILYAPNRNEVIRIKVRLFHNNKPVTSDSSDIVVYKQFVFLKADDVKFVSPGTLSTKWKKFFEYIESKQIKASIGLIGNSLEIGTTDYYSYLINLENSGLFEIWNHGYSHLLNGTNGDGEVFHEFWNTPLEEQKMSLMKTESLAKDKLNLTLHTFGAPGNAIDENTKEALNDISEIKVWYFGLEDSAKLVIKRVSEIEFPTHYPDYQKFIENYDPESPYLALQIHPNSWDENHFNEFKKIIDYLIAEKVTFINPYEYYQLVHQ